jgi:hypothetical protein
MKKTDRQRHMAQQRRQAKRRQRTPRAHDKPRIASTAEAEYLRSKYHQGGVEGALQYAGILMYNGRFEDAERQLDQAQRKWPLEARCHTYRATCRMLQGDYSAQTWREAEWMLRMPEVRQRPWFPERRWDGAAIPGKRLLIRGVGVGYGDVFWLSRQLPTIKRQSQAATVVLGVPHGLTKVMSALRGVDEIVEEPLESDPFDFHQHLYVMPGVPGYEFTPEVMSMAAYLTSDRALVEQWRPRVAERSQVHIGLHWQAEKTHNLGRERSVPLSAFAPLFDLPHTQFYGLQPGAQQELAAFPQVIDLGSIDAPGERFAATAAVLSCLDLVICCDSSISHLAGALNCCPVWLMLARIFAPQWSLLSSETPWYPQHTLFIQRQPGDWNDILEPVKDVLESFVRTTLRERRRGWAI